MKTDLYTKIILTMIAIGLTVIIFRDMDVIPNAKAQSSTSRTVMDVNIVSVCGDRLGLNNGNFKVRVMNKVAINTS